MRSRYRNLADRKITPRQQRLRAIRHGLLSVVLGLFAGIMGLWHWTRYHEQLSAQQEVAQSRLKAVVERLAYDISSQDVAMLAEVYITDSGSWGKPSQDPAYERLHRQLREAQALYALDTPVFVLVGSGQAQHPNLARFIATSSPRALPGRGVQLPPEVRQQFARGGVIDRDRDEYGLWVSAFHPIRAEDGGTVGIVQADQNFEHQAAEAYRQLWDGLVLSLVAWLATALVLIRLSASSQQHEAKLTRRLERARARARQHENTSASKTRLLAEVARDLRTPLNAVLGMSELLLESNLDPYQRQHCNATERSSRQLLAVLTDLSTHVEMQQGRRQAERTEFDLGAMFKRLETQWAEAATDRELTFVFRMPSRLPSLVTGDPTRLEQALTKLVENAFYHVELGTVEVAVCRRSQGNRWLELGFEIHDTGNGIPPDQLSNPDEILASDPEPQLRRYIQNFTQSRYQVLCLGGALEYGVNEAGGGDYSFSLPFAVINQIPSSDLEIIDSPEIEIGSGINVLIAEDDPASQRLISTLLDRWNCSHRVAEDGDLAVQMAQSESFDLILMDVSMPVLDGVAATRSIREFERETGQERSRIFALTAHTSEDERRACRSAGMDGFVAKPYSAADLREVVFARERNPVTS